MSASEEQTRRLAENRERQIKLRDELAQLKREEMELTGACPVDSLKGLPKGQGTQRPKLLPQDYGNAEGDGGPVPRVDTIAERLWAKFRKAPNPKPPAKELKEALGMLRQTNSHFKHGVHTVIDVCGGHGIVAMLMLIYRKCRRAIVLDLHQPPSHNALLKLWAEFFPGDAELVFRECDMTIELPGEIERAQALAGNEGRVAVFALHACDFLTDIAIEAAVKAGADFAVMPCCTKERFGGQLKAAARSQNISTEAAVDIVRLAEVQARGYACHWKTIDGNITQHNRILIGAPGKERGSGGRSGHTEDDIGVLKKRYVKLHALPCAAPAADTQGGTL